MKTSPTSTIDNDPLLGYELNSQRKKITNVLLIPLLNALPAWVRPLLKKSHKAGNDIIEHATTHRALEILYGYSTSQLSGNIVQNFFRNVWLNTNNSKAVRNRLRLVKREIRNSITELVNEGRAIRIASIASGSSRAIVEAIDSTQLDIKDISVFFVDKNQDAIAYSQEFTLDHKLRSNFNWFNGSAGDFFRNLSPGDKFNVIEMVGLIDYFNDEKAVKLFSLIHGSLMDKGVLITANISDNPERPFITKAVGWNMIYRSDNELVRLLVESGFTRDKMRIMYEPQRIHCVIVATK